MKELQLFNNPKFGDIRVVMNENGEPMFVANDVAKILNYSNPRDAVSKHCKSDGVAKRYIMDSLGRNQAMSVLNESNFYRLVMRSDMPDAEKFQDWVCEDILPSIRKHGAYMTNDTLEKAILSPDFLIQLATNLKDEQEKRSLLEKENAKLQPKADFVDKAVDIGHLSDIGQASKLLKLPYGRNTFFKKLREMGIFFKNRNEPKQEYIDRGYFELRMKNIPRDNHPSFMVTKVLVTVKGLLWLSEKLDGGYSTSSFPQLDIS